MMSGVVGLVSMKHLPVSLRWSELQVWHQGALVKHVRGLFKAEGINNSAEPGNTMHARFYVSIFNFIIPFLLG